VAAALSSRRTSASGWRRSFATTPCRVCSANCCPALICRRSHGNPSTHGRFGGRSGRSSSCSPSSPSARRRSSTSSRLLNRCSASSQCSCSPARKHVQHLGWAETDEVVLARTGWPWRHVTLVRVNKIQAVTLHQSPFDRRAAMARLRVDTAGAGEFSHRVDVLYLDHGPRPRSGRAAVRRGRQHRVSLVSFALCCSPMGRAVEPNRGARSLSSVGIARTNGLAPDTQPVEGSARALRDPRSLDEDTSTWPYGCRPEEVFGRHAC